MPIRDRVGSITAAIIVGICSSTSTIIAIVCNTEEVLF